MLIWQLLNAYKLIMIAFYAIFNFTKTKTGHATVIVIEMDQQAMLVVDLLVTSRAFLVSKSNSHS